MKKKEAADAFAAVVESMDVDHETFGHMVRVTTALQAMPCERTTTNSALILERAMQAAGLVAHPTPVVTTVPRVDGMTVRMAGVEKVVDAHAAAEVIWPAAGQRR